MTNPGRPPAIAAHRGGAFLWPENGLQAFRASAALPLEQIECDVHASRDGEAVVIHDPTLERTTDGRGPVAERTGHELRGLRLRGAGHERVPMLADMLGALAGSRPAPRVEIKGDVSGRPYPGLVNRVMAELDRVDMRRSAWVIGFDAPTMAGAIALGGLAGVAWLLEGSTLRSLGLRGVVAVAHAYGFPEIGVHEGVLDAETCAVLRTERLGISVWGANHAPSIRRMMGLGVDLLATDDPPLAIALRG